eukprot:TRINITY_DN9219_c0_g2_i4.p1 TRINITY_DN9219_c0_g2~~TRINITY_DN9219_c0_g2_i4.p1  ORF type:complete len:704 (-),score=191.07 TRINITY_DN9219_c0_g2_i4:396-2507(-)
MIQAQNAGINSLVEENEYHLKSIETMAKQLELYKSKSTTEISKKVSLLDSKAKQQARKFKSEAEYLNEILECKDAKIKSLEEEIEKLKTVVRAQASLGKSVDREVKEEGKKDVLERRVEEMVNSGKIEYRIFVTRDTLRARNHDVNKVLNCDLTSMLQANTGQAKIIEGWIQENKRKKLILDQNIAKGCHIDMDTINELNAQKIELDARIGEILLVEDILNRRFEEIVKIAEEFLVFGSSPNLKEAIERLNELKHLRERKVFTVQQTTEETLGTLDKYNAHEESSQEDFPPTRTIQFDELKDLMERNDIASLASLWREGGYVAPENSKDTQGTIIMLQAVCKHKDKELQAKSAKLQGEAKLQKCLELKNAEILELMTDYEEMKSKYFVATNVTIKELQEENKTLTERVISLEREVQENTLILDEEVKTNARKTISRAEFTQKDGTMNEVEEGGLESKIKELEERLQNKKKLKQEIGSKALHKKSQTDKNKNESKLDEENNKLRCNDKEHEKVKELIDKLAKEHSGILNRLKDEFKLNAVKKLGNVSDNLATMIKTEVLVAKEIAKCIDELVILKESSKNPTPYSKEEFPNRIEKLQHELGQFKQEVGRIKDSIKSKVNSQLENPEGQKMVEKYQTDEWQKEIEGVAAKCAEIEEELLALHEFKFQYTKQREELSAQHSTIVSLKSKLIRLEDMLNNKQNDYNR